MFIEEKRSDKKVQEAVNRLFLAAAPERSQDLQELWEKHRLQFVFFSDDSGPLLEAGAYVKVHFNHRMLRAIWVAAFAAWEAYSLAASEVAEEVCSADRLKELLALAIEIRDAKDPEAVPLRGVPEPGTFAEDPLVRAPAELAMFAAGWALLHEVRHLKHQQDGTGTEMGAPAEVAHAEELSCDAYAAKFLTEHVAVYASENNVEEARVRTKREVGIYFGLFAIIVLGHPKWQQTETHPSVSERLRNVRSILHAEEFDEALCIATLALAGLRQVWPEAPDFTR